MKYLKDKNKPEEFTLGVLLLLPALLLYYHIIEFGASQPFNDSATHYKYIMPC